MPNEAAKAYQDALRAKPGDFMLLAFAADFHRRADDRVEAQHLYERLLTPEVAAPAEFAVPARRYLALLLTERGEPAKALALIDDNIKTRGNALADERIRLFIQARDPRERQAALSKFQDSLRLQLPTPDERLLLAQMLEAADSLGQARAHLSEIVDQHPTAPSYLIRYARVLIKLGELAEAERMVARLQTLEPASDRVRSISAALADAKRKAVE